ncbi:MAG: hypothetical protein ACI91O_001703 [Candidatus Poriferisodalaceae bacterium]|jgi:hypothetical protein
MTVGSYRPLVRHQPETASEISWYVSVDTTVKCPERSLRRDSSLSGSNLLHFACSSRNLYAASSAKRIGPPTTTMSAVVPIRLMLSSRIRGHDPPVVMPPGRAAGRGSAVGISGSVTGVFEAALFEAALFEAALFEAALFEAVLRARRWWAAQLWGVLLERELVPGCVGPRRAHVRSNRSRL